MRVLTVFAMLLTLAAAATATAQQTERPANAPSLNTQQSASDIDRQMSSGAQSASSTSGLVGTLRARNTILEQQNASLAQEIELLKKKLALRDQKIALLQNRLVTLENSR